MILQRGGRMIGRTLREHLAKFDVPEVSPGARVRELRAELAEIEANGMHDRRGRRLPRAQIEARKAELRTAIEAQR
jgi:hypothetical protein